MKEQLEAKGCKLIVPQFPSPPEIPAKIAEWFEVFNKYQEDINENTIIIGHSLGGVFALRVLEQLKHPVRAVFLVGTPIGVKPIANYDRDNSFSGFDFNWSTIQSNSKHFDVFQSDNDPYVSLGNGKQLAKELGVELTFIPNAGHFNKKAGYLSFPDLLEKVRKIL
jgi:predicted alpha/beta hydrolase family esterase